MNPPPLSELKDGLENGSRDRIERFLVVPPTASRRMSDNEQFRDIYIRQMQGALQQAAPTNPFAGYRHGWMIPGSGAWGSR